MSWVLNEEHTEPVCRGCSNYAVYRAERDNVPMAVYVGLDSHTPSPRWLSYVRPLSDLKPEGAKLVAVYKPEHQ